MTGGCICKLVLNFFLGEEVSSELTVFFYVSSELAVNTSETFQKTEKEKGVIQVWLLTAVARLRLRVCLDAPKPPLKSKFSITSPSHRNIKYNK